MVSAFADHFSGHAADYARYRPGYPAALFAFLADCCAHHEHAWDCGTGNGQAARALAAHFQQVTATDASAPQLAHATPHERVTYQVAAAEQSPLPDHSADLITVAQALHWFDLDAFYAEVRRVAKPDGVLAVWTYSLLTVTPAVDAAVQRYYDFLDDYWPPERRHVEARYESLPFPFEPLETPTFAHEAAWTFRDLLGYLGTWSAAKRYQQAHAHDPVLPFREALATAWGDAAQTQAVRWELALRVGRVA